MLVSRRLDSDLLRLGLGHGVDYRPELADDPQELRSDRVDSGVWVAGDGVSEPGLEHWQRMTLTSGHPPVVVTANLSRALRRSCARRSIELCGPLALNGRRSLDLALLAAAERAEQRAASEPHWRRLGVGPSNGMRTEKRSVLLIGAGIVNLVTASALADAGFEVEILDAGADPRERGDWHRQGATSGGGNARMFCFTEADNYNDKGDRVYADMVSVFKHRATEGGWLVGCSGTRCPSFQTWVEHFESVAAWRARIFADDIHRFNRASAPLWYRMRRRRPALFDEAGFTPGVLRLYTEPEALADAVATQEAVGALRRMMTPEELARLHPGLSAACDGKAIAGAIEVEGFTVNIHDFVDRLVDDLERRHVRFTWRRRAAGWLVENGTVVGVRLVDGTTCTADHYVASPGAYGRELLQGTRCEGLLVGVAGLWMTLPNLEPRLRHSLKIHREGHCGEDANVTLAHDRARGDTLILGSGYAVVGHQHRLDLHGPEAQALYAAMIETVRRFFPRQYALGSGIGWRISPRACVRAFTPTGLGLFDGLPAAEGMALVTGGHNTGGFAQAPAIADAVVATLRGQSCAMQHLYDPRRGLE